MEDKKFANTKAIINAAPLETIAPIPIINVFVEMVFNLLFNILSSILNHNHLFNIKNKNREYPIKSHSSHPSKK